MSDFSALQIIATAIHVRWKAPNIFLGQGSSLSKMPHLCHTYATSLPHLVLTPQFCLP